MKELLDLKDPQLIQDINFSLLFRLHQWSQMPLLISKKARLFMKTNELQSGLSSGKLLSLFYSDYLQVFIFLKFIKLTEHLHYNGWVIIGTGLIFQDNFKMVQDGDLKVWDIVTIMTIWIYNMEQRDLLYVHHILLMSQLWLLLSMELIKIMQLKLDIIKIKILFS